MRRVMFLLAIVIAISACSSGADTATTTVPPGDESVASQAEESATTTTEVAATEEIVETMTTVSDAVAGGSTSCVGVWELDSKAFFDSYNETAAPSEQIDFVSGRYVVSWNTDGTFTDERVDWTFEFPGVEESGAMIMNSTGAGQWSDDGGEVVVASYELVETKISVIIDGEEFELPVTPGSLPAGAFDERTVTVCTESTMVSSGDGFVVTFDRIG